MTLISENCTVLLNADKQSVPTQDDILKQLEDTDDKVKVKALKSAIHMMLGGEPMPKMLMTVIRFCINTDHHEFKKLLMLFWEIVPKYDSERKLLPEMILVCNALRNDLNHSNEYVRGSMLRFLCKLREPEIIEPLVPSIKACLEHRHPYVRKNAALTIYHIHKYYGQTLVPDGAELMDGFIKTETEIGSRRNAFLMLFNEAEEMAIEFLASNAQDIDRFGDGFALVVLELTRKVCRRDPLQKSRFVQFLFQLLASPSPAVSYESAWTLVTLSSSPTAVRAAAATYTSLLSSQSDNNVKLIVLERLGEMKKRDARVLMDMLMDLLRALGSPNVDICKRTLEISMGLVSPRNIEEVIQVLKREIVRSKDSDLEKGTEYRALLIHAIHSCALKFPEIASSVVDILMDFLSVDGAMDVILFVRAMVEKYSELREGIIKKLVASFSEIKASNVISVGLWIIAEYSHSESELELGFEELLGALGMPPYSSRPSDIDVLNSDASHDIDNDQTKHVPRPAILPDGTYASQAFTTEQSRPIIASGHLSGNGNQSLRQFVCDGDIFMATIAAGALTKLAIKTRLALGELASTTKRRLLLTMQVICGIAELVYPPSSVDASPVECSHTRGTVCSVPGPAGDCLERLTLFTEMILDESISQAAQTSFVSDGKASLSQYLQHTMTVFALSGTRNSAMQDSQSSATQADNLITWRQLRSKTSSNDDYDLCDDEDLMRATGMFHSHEAAANRQSHVYQLSGFADPVYAEACVSVHDYDILLEIGVSNRTTSTLTNLTVELNTMGDLKLVERPQSLTIGPLDTRTVTANIKVSSTETGNIFGTIVYENSSNAEKAYVNLNNIHLDIMDYIHPAVCSDELFRSMWAEFEWENKVAIATSITDLGEFLEHIVQSTNMCCLTPRSSLGGASSFLAANLYAKSVFGEDALVNVSMEKKDDADGRLSGYIRIRSKTQGIALSLGDRITNVQRSTPQQKFG